MSMYEALPLQTPIFQSKSDGCMEFTGTLLDNIIYGALQMIITCKCKPVNVSFGGLCACTGGNIAHV